MYGPAALGRFAYAVLTVEFAAQIAALGLRRGLAQLLENGKKPQSCIVADALLVAALGSAIGMAILFLFPKAMYLTTPVGGLDRLLAITVLAISWTDIALAALAYHNDVGSTVRARSIVQPWIIGIAALALSFVPVMVSRGDGLIIAYVLSMVAALVAALIPLLRCYGLPHGWKPDLPLAWELPSAMRRSPPLIRSNGHRVESTWLCSAHSCPRSTSAFIMQHSRSRPCPPSSRPASSRSSAQPSCGAWRRTIVPEFAKQVRQVTYWIIAAQAGIALALGIPGRAVMGLVGSQFTGGTAMLAFLLAAEVIAAIAVVSEAALIYIARTANMVISLVMLALEAGLAAALILIMRDEGLPLTYQATGPAIALCVALAFASITKSWLLKRELGEPVSGWRWSIAWAAAAGVVVGAPARLFLPSLLQLIVGIPAMLAAFGAVLWTKGFGPEDRELFRMKKADVAGLREAEEAAQARDAISDDIV